MIQIDSIHEGTETDQVQFKSILPSQALTEGHQCKYRLPCNTMFVHRMAVHTNQQQDQRPVPQEYSFVPFCLFSHMEMYRFGQTSPSNLKGSCASAWRYGAEVSWGSPGTGSPI